MRIIHCYEIRVQIGGEKPFKMMKESLCGKGAKLALIISIGLQEPMKFSQSRYAPNTFISNTKENMEKHIIQLKIW